MNDLPYVMHPRYNEYLQFLENCPHRKSAAALGLGFWVWLKQEEALTVICKAFVLEIYELNKKIVINGDEYTKENMQLKSNLDRLHRERDSFHIQCIAQAEEIALLEKALSEVRG